MDDDECPKGASRHIFTTNAQKRAAEKRRQNNKDRAEGRLLPRGQNPFSSEIDYTPEEMEFMLALEKYKREKRRPFPTCREILKVLQTIGYRKA